MAATSFGYEAAPRHRAARQFREAGPDRAGPVLAHPAESDEGGDEAMAPRHDLARWTDGLLTRSDRTEYDAPHRGEVSLGCNRPAGVAAALALAGCTLRPTRSSNGRVGHTAKRGDRGPDIRASTRPSRSSPARVDAIKHRTRPSPRQSRSGRDGVQAALVREVPGPARPPTGYSLDYVAHARVLVRGVGGPSATPL